MNYQEDWSKCPFCGARNGLYGRPLEQHTPRCFYKGSADSRSISVPNHGKMIEEDDRTYLPMLRALHQLPEAQRKLAEAEKKIEALEARLKT